MKTRQQRRARGLCGECGEPCSEPTCAECKKAECAWKKRTRIERQLAGLCVDCGKCEPMWLLTRCPECRMAHLARDAVNKSGVDLRKKRREYRKAAGICVRCGEFQALPDITFCLQCKKRRMQTDAERRMRTG